MKNRIAWIAALMLLVFIMAACGPSEPANELEAVQQAGKIVMGTSADYPPFEYYDDAGEMAGFDVDLMNEIAKRMGAPAKDLSPTFHVTSATPPTIIFHGEKDTTVPYAQVEAFTKAMKEARNKCEAVGFENQGHGFFNFSPWFERTLHRADEFLASLGYVSGPPTFDPPEPA